MISFFEYNESKSVSCTEQELLLHIEKQINKIHYESPCHTDGMNGKKIIVIRPKRDFRFLYNSFLPIIKIDTTKLNSDGVIKISAILSPEIQFFLLVFICLNVLFIVASVIILHTIQIQHLIPVFLCVFACCLSYFCFTTLSKRILKILAQFKEPKSS